MTENPNPFKDVKSLAKKVVEIMAEIEPLTKDGYNAAHDYKYTYQAQVLDMVRKLLVEKGIAIFPNVVSSEILPDKSRGGMNITKVIIDYTLVDSESGEFATLRWDGQGADTTDKGIYKAYTGTNKYFMLQTFGIPMIDDVDSSSPENDPTAPYKRKQQPKGGARKSDKGITAKRGTEKDPGYCTFCGKKHIVKGMMITKSTDGNYGAVACIGKQNESKEARPASTPTDDADLPFDEDGNERVIDGPINPVVGEAYIKGRKLADLPGFNHYELRAIVCFFENKLELDEMTIEKSRKTYAGNAETDTVDRERLVALAEYYGKLIQAKGAPKE